MVAEQAPRPSACPDENELVAYLRDALAPRPRRTAIRAHLDACRDCDELVAVMTCGTAPDRGPGTRVGRFLIGARIGAGAMGIVYAAHDDQLGRTIALKLLHRSASADLTRRLLREAQAMARLAHPNVVTVHECGVLGEEVFIAMELVAGETLATWIGDALRPWREIVTTFVQAGRGLVAAHAAGIVHRDFKPSNVIVGRDHRVRLLDFGLARLEHERPEEPTAPPRAPRSDANVDATRTGATLGTPAYMSPEQRRGEPATERSDQYSFCVALHEALHGARPPHTSRAVPRRVRRILERGLAERADQRFTSMAALVDALEATLRRPVRAIASALVVMTVVTVAVASTRATAEGPAARTCADAGRHLTGIWDRETKRSVQAAFHATRTVFGEDAWRTVEHTLDRYAADWADARTAACTATRVLGDQTEAHMGLRMQCLDRHLQSFTAVVARLRIADAPTVEKAVHAARALPSLDACATLAHSEPAPPSEPLRAGVAQLRGQLADARTLLELGKYAEGAPIANTALAAAHRIDYRPLVAEATWLAGALQARLGDYARAEALLRDAIRAAESSRHDELAARSWIGLTIVTGLLAGNYADGLEAGKFAQAALERLGPTPEVQLELTLAVNRAWLFDRLGRRVEALAHAYRARDLAAQHLGPDDLHVAHALEALAMLHSNLALHATALDYSERARIILERAYGPRHPEVGISLGNLALLRHRVGDHVTAETLGTQAFAILDAAVGADHPSTASVMRLVGLALITRDRWSAALPWFERTLAVHQRTMGPDHPEVGIAMAHVALCLLRTGRAADAVPLAARAYAIRTASDAPDDAATIGALITWGEALVATGQRAPGITKLEASLALLAHAPDPDLEASARRTLARARPH